MPSRTVREIDAASLEQFHPFAVRNSSASIGTRQQAAQKTARQLAAGLKERFQAKRVMLFGSATRTDFCQTSDIDLAVWGIAASDYLQGCCLC